jgi:hypothetical protein
MSEAQENAIKRLRTNEALEEELEQANKTIDELVEVLNNAADALEWFKKYDFALTYRVIAAKYKQAQKD